MLTERKFKNTNLNLTITTYADNEHTIYFKGKEVAETLGYTDSDQAIRKNVDEEDKKNLPRPGDGSGQTPSFYQ